MTILADLAVRLARSAEDIATEGLRLILARSAPASGALEGLLREWTGGAIAPIRSWRSQVVATDNSRTDLEGFGESDETLVVLENKFWAGLTENQPTAYLSRLPSGGGGALVFVAPSVRLAVLEVELSLRAREAGELVAPFSPGRGATVTRLASGRWLILTSWGTLCSAMAHALESAQAYEDRADLRQIEGLASRMEREGFRPFTTMDLTSNAPVLVLQSCRLVDQVVARLLAEQVIHKKGFRATGGAGWYGHYFSMQGYGCQLAFSASRWAAHGISPIWLGIASSNWKVPSRVRSTLAARLTVDRWVEETDGTPFAGLWMPLSVPEGREEVQVVDVLASRLRAIADVLGTIPETAPATEPAELS